jgi:phosphate transport system protein
VGVVLRKSNPFPKSVFENGVFGPHVAGLKDHGRLAEIGERRLKQAALWDEMKDRLHDSALNLSGGQQRRLCIARAIAGNPKVLRMDKPASALDLASTARIQDLIFELKRDYTIVIGTHNMQQAVRVLDLTALFQGRLIAHDTTASLFTRPRVGQTEDYLTGRFGLFARCPLSVVKQIQSPRVLQRTTDNGQRTTDNEMTKHLERDLENLQRDLLTLAASVEEAIHKATRALQQRDPKLARQVIDGDNEIDEEENHVEEECLKILALHQPVAVDLRRIAAAMKINTDLERMADLAEDIAERAVHLSRLPEMPVPEKLQRMTDLTTSMVRQSLDAFVQLDTRLARVVCRLDDEVDNYNSAIIEELIGVMRRSPEMVEPALSLFSATRHLERIADHATNIAEDVVYLAEGEIIRHRPGAVNVED